MRIRKNGKVINLTESDLRRIVKRVIHEQDDDRGTTSKDTHGTAMKVMGAFAKAGKENKEAAIKKIDEGIKLTDKILFDLISLHNREETNINKVRYIQKLYEKYKDVYDKYEREGFNEDTLDEIGSLWFSSEFDNLIKFIRDLLKVGKPNDNRDVSRFMTLMKNIGSPIRDSFKKLQKMSENGIQGDLDTVPIISRKLPLPGFTDFINNPPEFIKLKGTDKV